MTSECQQLLIDSHCYQIQFRGFAQPLNAQLEGGDAITLKPWPLAHHLNTLDRCSVISPAGVALDSAALAAQVLCFSAVAPHLHAAFEPLALWWASAGAIAESPTPSGSASGGEDDSAVIALGAGLHAHLRLWTGAERLAAVMACQPETAREASQAPGPGRLGTYLGAMLQGCVRLDDPEAGDLAELDAGATSRLLQAVVRLNVLAASPRAEAMCDSPLAAEATLRFCRALGWTPSQVWRTPALELDRLARLLDQSAGWRRQASPPHGRFDPRGLARHPDAVVIEVENPDNDL
jgi:hypothetical protein